IVDKRPRIATAISAGLLRPRSHACAKVHFRYCADRVLVDRNAGAAPARTERTRNARPHPIHIALADGAAIQIPSSDRATEARRARSATHSSRRAPRTTSNGTAE